VASVVARILGGQTLPASDVPALIDTVRSAVARILNPPPPAPEIAAPKEAQPARRGRPRGRPRGSTGRKRGRPRKIAPPEPIEAPAPPAAPRLVRRAEAVAAPPASNEPALLEAPPSATVRGVVRWFDPARQTGGLRLTGVPEDVAVEPAVFAAAGVTRLFKGQEVEAELSRTDGRVRVTALRIPGGAGGTASASGPIAAMGGRRPRVVIVEKKLDALKRVAARTEAEHLLGSNGQTKPQR
jgi:cold shock CspA family protein